MILQRNEDMLRLQFPDNYSPAQWGGILRINDATPGFDVVLADGDMRLYRIR